MSAKRCRYNNVERTWGDGSLLVDELKGEWVMSCTCLKEDAHLIPPFGGRIKK